MGKAVIIMGIVILLLLVVVSFQIPKITAAEKDMLEARELARTTKAP